MQLVAKQHNSVFRTNPVIVATDTGFFILQIMKLLPEEITSIPTLSGTAKLLYLYLRSKCDKDGWCRFTNEHLAIAIGVSRRTVINSLQPLADHLLLGVFYGDEPQDRVFKVFAPDKANKYISGNSNTDWL